MGEDYCTVEVLGVLLNNYRIIYTCKLNKQMRKTILNNLRRIIDMLLEVWAAVVTNICVEVSIIDAVRAGVGLDVLITVTIRLDFNIPASLKKCLRVWCFTTLSCGSITVLDFFSPWQAWMPSYHV